MSNTLPPEQLDSRPKSNNDILSPMQTSMISTNKNKIKKTLIFILIRYIVFHIMEIAQVEQDRLLWRKKDLNELMAFWDLYRSIYLS